jgi:hypothetical protein
MNGKLQIETISSLVLKDNALGDPRRREVPVYLPPSYGSKRGRRYPVSFFCRASRARDAARSTTIRGRRTSSSASIA